MTTEDETEQEQVWGRVYDAIVGLLRRFGVEDHFGHGDYLVVDDNYGHRRNKVEVHKLHMLQPAIVNELQMLLRGTHDWEIVLAVDVPGTEGKWPPMGVTIRQHEIIDGLQRQFLPKEFEQIVYVGSRPGTGYD